MVHYDLAHLTQHDDQQVIGPIQDDEALFLFALIRGMRLKRVLEIGGLDGYSATNFIRAVGDHGTVYTVDLNPVNVIAENHKTIIKDVGLLDADDLDDSPIDLVFFDCHVFDVQLAAFHKLRDEGLINDRTVIALHDTHLHPGPFIPWAYHIDQGWVHQEVERRLVNEFKDLGYDVFNLHTDLNTHTETLPYRHGLSICRKFERLLT